MKCKRKFGYKNIIYNKFCILYVVFLAVILRLIRLGTFSFWNDECHNLLVSDNLYGAIVEGELIANHPPLPYILLAVWRFIGMGGSEWTIRGLPLLFGVLGVIAVFWFAKLLFGNRVGLIAAFLLAISPFHMLHSQDLKEYIYLPFFATITVGFFYLAIEGNKGRHWFLYGLFAGICCYTEAFAAPLLLAINLWFLAQWPAIRSRFKGWFLANTFGALLFLPWLGIMLKRVHMYLVSAEHWWVPWPTLWSVLFYFKTIAFGYTAQKPEFYLAFMLFAVAALAGGVIAVYKNRRGASLLICWAILPVVIVFAMSYIGQSIFLIRAMLPYSIAVYILVAVGIAAIPAPVMRTSVLLVITILCSIGLYNYYARNYHPQQHPHRPGTHPPRAYEEAAEHILDRLEQGDLVIHASQATWFPFQWYGFASYPHHVGGSNEPFNQIILSSNPVTTTYEDYLPLWPDVIEEIIDRNPRIWFVFSEWERGYLAGNAMSLYRWLDSKYVEVEHATLKGIDIFLYLTPDHPDMPEIIERDVDTGVTSLLTYASQQAPYFKVMPDAGLIETPLEQRKGNLELRFGHPEAQGNVAFTVENKGDAAVECDIMLLQSSYFIAFDSLSRKNPTENVWNYSPYWNTQPPPQVYDLGAVSGRFEQGVSEISRTILLDSGTYWPYVYSIAPWNTPKWNMASITIMAENRLLVDAENMPVMEEPGWKWVRGNPVVVDEKKAVEIVVAGEGIDGLPEVYANMGYLAFIDEKALPPNVQDGLTHPEWLGSATFPPGGLRQWEQEINAPPGRIDVWVFERNNEQGKAYHIFRLVSVDEDMKE